MYHNGEGLLNYAEELVIRAEDDFNQPGQGYTGLITIYLDTGVTGAAIGNLQLTKRSGAGALTSLGSYRWTYQMMYSDNGTVTLGMNDNLPDTLDIEATDGFTRDNDRAPQYFYWRSVLYHYVRQNNIDNDIAPYDTPGKAATNIEDAIAAAAPGHFVVIIDNETYPKIRYWDFEQNNALDGITIAGHPTNSPIIDGGAGYCLEIRNHDQVTFDNLIFKSTGDRFIYTGQMNNPGPMTYRNCTFWGGSGNRAILGDGDVTNHILFSTFTNIGGTYGIDFASGSKPKVIGSRFVDINVTVSSFMNNTGTSPATFSGNLFAHNPNSGAAFDTTTAANPVANYNTAYAFNMGIQTTGAKYNNIAVNCTGYGISSGSGDYNVAFGNTPNYNAYTTGGNDSDGVDPLFVDPANNDFRLRADSPVYNKGMPNGSVSACPGYHTIGVRQTYKVVDMVSTYTLTYAPKMDIPNDALIKITFPDGFDLSSVNAISTTSPWGGGIPAFNVGVAGQTITIARAAGNTAPAWTAQNLIIPNIVNPSVSSNLYSVKLWVENALPSRIGSIIA